MKGVNELHFNLATMIVAVEFYLNHEVLREGAGIKVDGVRFEHSSGGDDFVVSFMPQKEKP